ncbi:MAG: isoprenylcysteine carboxylmethyltransferase family protein [Pseudorhodoplanes sp.]|jgi:methyltransferase|nr:isoprenylcysteine carboxylmethyltransferase family protein [Pseudorhodoplanes sp.]
MGEGGWLVLFIACQRIGELLIDRRNTIRLLAAGGIECGRAHYPLIVALHLAWIVGLWIFGRLQDVDRAWLIVFIVLQAARIWCLASLGARWTTRIIVLPGTPLVGRGPYRFMKHPNYAVVAAEIAVVPLALGLPAFAALFTVANGLILLWRMHVENAALTAAGPIRGKIPCQ